MTEHLASATALVYGLGGLEALRDFWMILSAHGSAATTRAAGRLRGHNLSPFETGGYGGSLGRAYHHAWPQAADHGGTVSRPANAQGAGGTGLGNLDFIPANLLDRAWGQSADMNETAAPVPAPVRVDRTRDARALGAEIEAIYTAARATWLATSRNGMAEPAGAFPDADAEVVDAVGHLFAGAVGSAGNGADATLAAAALGDDALWDALAPGAALVQAGGPTRGTQPGAAVDEIRTPWELLFSPVLFAFTTPRRYQATILLVEHDELTRDTFHELLAQQGYLVLAAGTAHDAWGVLRTPLAPIDLVLLDAHLPDVSGMMLYARMRELYPELPVVICTDGALDPDELASFRTMGAPFYLCKPITCDKLLATVQAVLS